MSPDTVKYFEGLLTVYTDNIKISDIKSNIILFFLADFDPDRRRFSRSTPDLCPVLSVAAASAVLDHRAGPGELSRIRGHAGLPVFHQAVG